MMRHDIETNLTPVCLGGTGSMISKLDEGNLEELEIIELKPPVPDMAMDMNLIRRGKRGRIHNGVTLEEWRKRLTMLPEDIVKKT
eukprot:5577798-Ditylum_brightwellii.AAC.1